MQPSESSNSPSARSNPWTWTSSPNVRPYYRQPSSPYPRPPRGGRYRPRGARSPSWLVPSQNPPVAREEDQVKSWCEERMEKIKETLSGGSALPELKQWIDRMELADFAVLEKEIGNKRREKLAAMERLRRSTRERKKAERALERIERAERSVDVKIGRLREYCGFIDRGWKDVDEKEEVAPAAAAAAGEPKESAAGTS